MGSKLVLNNELVNQFLLCAIDRTLLEWPVDGEIPEELNTRISSCKPLAVNPY